MRSASLSGRPGRRSALSRRWARLADAINRWGFMAPSLVLLGAVLAYPILYTIEISFAELDLATFQPGEWVGWDNYVETLTDDRFWNALKVTGIYLLFAHLSAVDYLGDVPWDEHPEARLWYSRIKSRRRWMGRSSRSRCCFVRLRCMRWKSSAAMHGLSRKTERS